MIRAGIIGGAGYTAGELIRLLTNHPEVSVEWVHSTSNAGHPVEEIHAGLVGDTDLRFSSEHPLDAIDVLFLCSGHGKSTEFWTENALPSGLRVIDLAQDFRDESAGYVYGLPEVNRARIAAGRLTANPGCFATAMQLALLPMARAGLLPEQVQVTGMTGSTGAGVKPGATTHFSWRSDNVSVYKPFTHQHMAEVGRTLSLLQHGFDPAGISFVPMRGPFARGIFLSAWMDTPVPAEEVRRIYSEAYADEPFTYFTEGDVWLKQAVNTNKAIVGIVKQGRHLLVNCAIDNLLKGASGQAVQNMNIMFGLPERTGLCLKASAF